MKKEQIQARVQEYGGIDKACPEGTPMSKWRKLCQDKGVKFVRPRTTRDPVSQAAPESQEAILAQENAELRTALSRARETQTRDERVLRLLEESIEKKAVRYQPAPVRDLAGTRPHEFVLLWSDLHAAETVFSDQTHGLNEYDWDIMLGRHDKLTKALLSFKTNRPYPVPRLRILGLGDMVSGDIHDELRVTNEKVLMEAALQLGLDAAEWIEGLIPFFEEITLDGIVGNHGRTTAKPSAKNQHSNFDWMVYHIIRLRLASHPSVTVNVPKSPVEFVEVMGRRLFMFHGDGVRSAMPGVPWGGIQRRVNELRRTYEPTFGHIDHFVLGHWHEPNVVFNRNIIVNGSVKGPDEFSLKYFGGGSDATQVLLVFNEKYGLTETAFLDLQGRVIA